MRLYTSSNMWFLWPTRVNFPNNFMIVSAIFAGLTVVTDRQTDRPCYSVCSNKPHPASALIWPINYNCFYSFWLQRWNIFSSFKKQAAVWLNNAAMDIRTSSGSSLTSSLFDIGWRQSRCMMFRFIAQSTSSTSPMLTLYLSPATNRTDGNSHVDHILLLLWIHDPYGSWMPAILLHVSQSVLTLD